MSERYQFICGYLKASEKKLFTGDTRRRIEASSGTDDLFRAVVETHFQPLVESGYSDERLLHAAEEIVGEFASQTYRYEGSAAVFYGLIPGFIEAVKLIWLGSADRMTTCGLTLEQIKNPWGLPPVISRNISLAVAAITRADSLRQLEHYAFIEKRRLMNDLSNYIGSGLKRLNHELLKLEDAFLFYWFLPRNPGYLDRDEMVFLKPHLTGEFSFLADMDITMEVLKNFTVYIRVKDPVLADTCLLFMKAELKDALVLKDELKASIIRKFPVMEVGPFYPVNYFSRLSGDLRFLKRNILRVIAVEERRKHAA